MNDLNFFEFYNGRKRSKIDKDVIFYIIILALVVCVLLYTGINAIKITKLNDEITELTKQLEIKKTNRRLNENVNKEKEINNYKEVYSRLKTVNGFINSKYIIDETLLHEISTRVPEALFLKSIYLNNDSITIEGVSQEKKYISDFEYRLSEVGYFEEIFIPAIYKEYDYFSFSINIKLKDVNEDGEQNLN